MCHAHSDPDPSTFLSSLTHPPHSTPCRLHPTTVTQTIPISQRYTHTLTYDYSTMYYTLRSPTSSTLQPHLHTLYYISILHYTPPYSYSPSNYSPYATNYSTNTNRTQRMERKDGKERSRFRHLLRPAPHSGGAAIAVSEFPLRSLDVATITCGALFDLHLICLVKSMFCWFVFPFKQL